MSPATASRANTSPPAGGPARMSSRAGYPRSWVGMSSRRMRPVSAPVAVDGEVGQARIVAVQDQRRTNAGVSIRYPCSPGTYSTPSSASHSRRTRRRTPEGSPGRRHRAPRRARPRRQGTGAGAVGPSNVSGHSKETFHRGPDPSRTLSSLTAAVSPPGQTVRSARYLDRPVAGPAPLRRAGCLRRAQHRRHGDLTVR